MSDTELLFVLGELRKFLEPAAAPVLWEDSNVLPGSVANGLPAKVLPPPSPPPRAVAVLVKFTTTHDKQHLTMNARHIQRSKPF